MKLFASSILAAFITIVSNAQTIIKIPTNYLTIQGGLDAANAGDIVLVQPGEYKENIIWPDVSNVQLLGADSNLKTILNGQSQSFVIYFNRGNNEIDSNTIISNFVIKNGGNFNKGGGIYLNNCSPKLNNLEISFNKSLDLGGGIFAKNSNIILTNSIINDNTAAEAGGGIYAEFCDLTIKNVNIVNNRTRADGGGIAVRWSSLELTNSIFTLNQVDFFGGGLYSWNSNNVIKDVTFVQNTSLGNGGGFDAQINLQNNFEIDNCDFIQNSAKFGGGVSLSNDFEGGIDNCLFYDNNASDFGSAVYVESDKPTYINNSVVLNNNKISVYNNSTTFLPAINNYWGDKSGPYNKFTNIDGRGDEVASLINYSPWLNSYPANAPIYPVQNISVVSTSDNSITLLWAVIDIGDIAGYKIYFDAEQTNWEFSNSIDVGLDTIYTLANLDIGKTYYLSVTCYDNDGNESWFSETISAKTKPAPIIELNYSQIEFGESIINKDKAIDLLISNTGSEVLTIFATETSTNNFYTNQNIELNINPSESKLLPIYFNPTLVGAMNDILVIRSNAVNYPELLIPLLGEGVLSDAPVIISIDDVPEDQGGQVRIKFQSSRYEGSNKDSIIQTYSVWRQINNSNEWDALGLFNALHEPFYNYVAPTIGDSTVHELIWSKFKVSAHSSDPNIFYMSVPDSGYSIDNIAPEIPMGLNANSVNGIVVELSWQMNKEKDFAYYAIYRGHDEYFVADSASLLSITTDSMYSDSEILNGTYYYKISAFDYSGNESELSDITDVLVGVDDQKIIPKDYSLNQNFPNPFNPSTVIKFSIPELSKVRLTVYNALGEFVMVLLDKEFSAGHHETKWHAENQTSGIYFIKIDAESILSDKHYSNTIKAILLK